MPGSDRRDWFLAYGRETGPLNAKGMIVSVDGRPIPLQSRGFDLAIEDHPRFTFHFEMATPLPPRGRLSIQDTNFASSEGTSRLALRGKDGMTIQGDTLPADVNQVAIRPVWDLTDAEERRTKQVVVDYHSDPTKKISLGIVPGGTDFSRSNMIRGAGPSSSRSHPYSEAGWPGRRSPHASA